MDYSKKDLAAKFQVTTQALDKRLNKLNLRDKCVKDDSNRLWIPSEVAQILADSYSVRLQEVDTGFQLDETDWKALYFEEKERANQQVGDFSADIISLLKAELEAKDKQIADLSRLLDQEQKLLAQEQKLHAATKEEMKRLLEAPVDAAQPEIVQEEAEEPEEIEVEPEQEDESSTESSPVGDVPVYTVAQFNNALNKAIHSTENSELERFRKMSLFDRIFRWRS